MSSQVLSVEEMTAGQTPNAPNWEKTEDLLSMVTHQLLWRNWKKARLINLVVRAALVNEWFFMLPSSVTPSHFWVRQLQCAAVTPNKALTDVHSHSGPQLRQKLSYSGHFSVLTLLDECKNDVQYPWYFIKLQWTWWIFLLAKNSTPYWTCEKKYLRKSLLQSFYFACIILNYWIQVKLKYPVGKMWNSHSAASSCSECIDEKINKIKCLL